MTNRVELINFLLHKQGAVRYLEISMQDNPAEFGYILCQQKRFISPRSYDKFFTSNTEKFDIIFIDGLHTECRVLTDIKNAFTCLTDKGVIVLHDCMPPDAWHQRSFEEYNEGENWNGTAWMAALRTFNSSNFNCTLIDVDWGCGIIDTGSMQQPVMRQLPEELSYELHYSWLLEYKVSVAQYIRDQVTVFYHLACMDNWKEIFNEQMYQLSKNGFCQIHLSVLGTKHDLEAAQAILEESGVEAITLFYDPDLTYFEKPALLAIEDFAKNHNTHVLYLHSKGVSNARDETKNKWRRLMMRELVEKWEQCMLQLLKYDIVGVNWRSMPPISHFSGNFWYASTSYLRKLADFKAYYDNPLYKIWDRINDKRLGCEFWIGSGRETPKVLSLVYKDVDFCNPGFWVGK